MQDRNILCMRQVNINDYFISSSLCKKLFAAALNARTVVINQFIKFNVAAHIDESTMMSDVDINVNHNVDIIRKMSLSKTV